MSLSSLRTPDFIWYECSHEDGEILIKLLYPARRFFAVVNNSAKPWNVTIVVSAHVFRDEQYITSLINDHKWDNPE